MWIRYDGIVLTEKVILLLKVLNSESFQGNSVQSQSKIEKAKYISEKLNPNNIVINHYFLVVCYTVNNGTQGKSHVAISKVNVLFYSLPILYESPGASISLPIIIYVYIQG